jgi:hypothetical protein
MSDLKSSAELPARVRTMQILISALVAGPLLFAVVAIVMSQERNVQPRAPILSYVQIGLSIILFIAHLVVRRLMVASGRKRISAGTWESGLLPKVPGDLDNQERMLVGLYQTQMIITAALLEGAVFALLVGFMVEGQAICLALAGLFLVRIVSLIPGRTRVERWIETQQEAIEMDARV